MALSYIRHSLELGLSGVALLATAVEAADDTKHERDELFIPQV